MIKEQGYKLRKEIKKTSNKLVTFDIFDTLLTRLVCSPYAVFYFVGKTAADEGLISCSPENYILLRREAEKIARTGFPDGEIPDLEIFKALIRLLGVNKETGKRLREIEIEWETRLLVPVPGAYELLDKHRKEGYQIVFISDMYWTKDVLQSFLEIHGFWHQDDQLWVSCEHGACKLSSKLFHKVLEHNKVTDIAAIRHYGNHKDADYNGALKAGLSSTLMNDGNPTVYESLLEEYTSISGGATSLLSGAGRILRIKHANDTPKNAGIARIVGNVIGPSLTLYVLWLIRSAQAQGIKQLYFIARDGYVPFKIAQKLAAVIAPEMKISYMYGSRQAWHIAGLYEFNEDTFYWLLGNSDGATAASALKRAGLSWEEVLALAPEIGERIKQPDARTTGEELDYLKSAILGNKALQQRMLDEAKSRRELLLGYLDQENFDRTEKAGMVEIGWGGNTRMSFERILGRETSQNLHWFYLGLIPTAKAYEPERVHAFLYGPMLSYDCIISLPVIAESFCFAPHGSVQGFAKKEGNIIAEFKEGIEAKFDEWGRSFYLSLIDEYCGNISLDVLQSGYGFDYRTAAYHLLKEFSENPSREDAMVWGDLPFEHDQSGTETYSLAPEVKLDLRTIKEAITYGTFAKTGGGGQMGAWGAGAWANRKPKVAPLSFFVFLGHMRVNGGKEVRRILSETKTYFKKLVKADTKRF